MDTSQSAGHSQHLKGKPGNPNSPLFPSLHSVAQRFALFARMSVTGDRQTHRTKRQGMDIRGGAAKSTG